MATKKPAAKKVAAKKPAPLAKAKVDLAKAKVKQAQADVELKKVDVKIAQAAAKPAPAKKAAPVKPVKIEVHGAVNDKPTKRTVKLTKEQSKAFHAAKTPKEQALVAASAVIKSPERVRRAAQGLEKAAANIKAKVNDIIKEQEKPKDPPSQKPSKKAALVPSGTKPTPKPAPAPSLPSVQDVWGKSLSGSPAPEKKSHNEVMKDMLRAPADTSGFSLPPARPTLPPAAAKVAAAPKPGSMSVADMNAAITARQRPVGGGGFDVSSLPFKRQ